MSEILEQLFVTGGSPEPADSRRFIVLKKSGRPFLLLPSDRAKAVRALSLYPAQRAGARLARSLLSGALSIRLPLPLAGVSLCISQFDPFARFLQIQAGTRRVPDFAVLIGNPNVPGRRQVILVFDAANNPAVAVKAGAGEAAVKLIEQERSFLKAAPETAKGIPKLRGHFDAPHLKAFALDYVEGESPSAQGDVTSTLADVLDSWINSSRTIELGATSPWLQLRSLCRDHPLFQRIDGQLAARRVHPVIQHGDLAPWNIRVSPRNGDWRVLDWERGQLEGIPGWDWFHYLIQVSILVQRREVNQIIQAIDRSLGSETFKEYAAKTGINNLETELLLLYLLHTIEVVRPTEGITRLRGLLEHFTHAKANG